LIDLARLNRANKVLDMILDESNEHEPDNAARALITGLRADGFKSGDLLLIGKTTPAHDQCLMVSKLNRDLMRQNQTLYERVVELTNLLTTHQQKPSIKLVGAPEPAPTPIHPSSPPVVDIPVAPIEHPARKPLFNAKKPRKEAVSRFDWHAIPELELQAAVMFITGKRNADICKLVGCNNDQLSQHFYNSPPPIKLAGAYLHDAGPMDWPEAWFVGGWLYRHDGKAWMRRTVNELGLKDRSPPTVLNAAQDKIDALRERYRVSYAEKEAKRLQDVQKRTHRPMAGTQLSGSR
jgi:hypothetical protein